MTEMGIGRLQEKRVLVTQADDYMGPAIARLFVDEGAEVIAHRGDLTAEGACEAAVEAAGELDVLVANLALPPHPAPVGEIRDDDWHALFDRLVHPLMRLTRAVAPAMIARERGKIVAVTSAAPLRGIPRTAAYCAARGAQNAFVRAAGLELAERHVQLNAIAQNYVHNPTYYPDELLQSERFQKHVQRNVPAGRVAEGSETAELALFLASDRSDFIVGQVVPFAGGWTTTTG
jgi:2-keto-3-deoxy-L-fuconate dehydrogenase